MKTIVLGIETSCDETAAAVVSDDRTILSNVVFSQIDDHKPYGGVIPELSARQHLHLLPKVIDQALSQGGVALEEVTAIAATGGPGLIGGVIVGVMMAKSMAFHQKKPFIAVNHLEGHALTARLTHDVSFPFMLLLVSGGHTQIIHVSGVGQYHLLGTTLDDAVGETFDKVAKMLGLSYPGGPALERYAEGGDATAIAFPKPLFHRPDCQLSFSGLKTAVRVELEKNLNQGSLYKKNVAASFQETVSQVLLKKLENALGLYPNTKNIVVAGGVAANKRIRQGLETIAEKNNKKLFLPPISLCTDNAAMIAWAGTERFKMGHTSSFDFAPRPRWPLSDL
ncbi:MAG: tRNA (adenosine(37)-N6)-threonylcarbamoyltransferase complex transferase subunit TsaD [Holosporaceae bacterium]|nr:MAG: tRNA (adenosine(37)-N6)-threonylcarbamoyltransferase complex transferase subunit TsaD [Holosporaceae bacterium]